MYVNSAHTAANGDLMVGVARGRQKDKKTKKTKRQKNKKTKRQKDKKAKRQIWKKSKRQKDYGILDSGQISHQL